MEVSDVGSSSDVEEMDGPEGEKDLRSIDAARIHQKLFGVAERLNSFAEKVEAIQAETRVRNRQMELMAHMEHQRSPQLATVIAISEKFPGVSPTSVLIAIHLSAGDIHAATERLAQGQIETDPSLLLKFDHLDLDDEQKRKYLQLRSV